MAHLTGQEIYLIAISIALAVSLASNVVSFFECRNYNRQIAIYERQLATMRQKMRQLPPASKLLRGLPPTALKLVTNNKSRQVINKLLSPKKDK